MDLVGYGKLLRPSNLHSFHHSALPCSIAIPRPSRVRGTGEGKKKKKRKDAKLAKPLYGGEITTKED